MASVFDGAPDNRQSGDNAPPSRFRPRYRQLGADELALHDAIKAKAAELESLFEQVKPDLYYNLAMTALEQSVMWIVKQMTA